MNKILSKIIRLTGVALVVATSLLSLIAPKPVIAADPFYVSPDKQPKDAKLLGYLKDRNIDKNFVSLESDYGTKASGKSPYMQTYRDVKSGKRFALISSLPMVDASGLAIDVGWIRKGSEFHAKNNLFSAIISTNGLTTVTTKNDQADGRKAGDALTFSPILSVGGVIKPILSVSLLAIDPINLNYLQNVLVFDYGVAKRYVRIIEGRLLGSWVFPSNPNSDVKITYNQTGNFKLELGRFKSSGDEEYVPLAVFQHPTEYGFYDGYPITIQDSLTFYPDASETTSIDGFVQWAQTTTWATMHGAAAGHVIYHDASVLYVELQTSPTNPLFTFCNRTYLLFDTSGLPDSANITDATLSLYGVAKSDTAGWGIAGNIFSGVPQTNTDLTFWDYDISHFGVGTPFSTAINYAGWSTAGWNDYVLNASGIASINTTGVSKFGWLESVYDAPNVAPGWSASQVAYLRAYSAENGINIPKLVVTYGGTPPLPPPPLIAGNVLNLKALPSNTSVQLSWTKAVDGPITIIRYRTDTYPSSPTTDGTLAYNGTNWYTNVTGLTPGTTYYFAAWGYDGVGYSPSPATCAVTTYPISLPSGGEETHPPVIPVPTVPSSANATANITGFQLEPFASIIRYFVTGNISGGSGITPGGGGLGMPENNAWEVLAIGGIVMCGIGTYIKMKNFFIAYAVIVILSGFFVGLHLVQWYLVPIELAIGAGVWAIERAFQ